MYTISIEACLAGWIIAGACGAMLGRVTSGAAQMRLEIATANRWLTSGDKREVALKEAGERQARRITALENEATARAKDFAAVKVERDTLKAWHDRQQSSNTRRKLDAAIARHDRMTKATDRLAIKEAAE